MCIDVTLISFTKILSPQQREREGWDYDQVLEDTGLNTAWHEFIKTFGTKVLCVFIQAFLLVLLIKSAWLVWEQGVVHIYQLGRTRSLFIIVTDFLRGSPNILGLLQTSSSRYWWDTNVDSEYLILSTSKYLYD